MPRLSSVLLRSGHQFDVGAQVRSKVGSWSTVVVAVVKAVGAHHGTGWLEVRTRLGPGLETK